MMQAALSCAGPTVHNKRVRISTQLATNGLSQAVKGQGKTVTELRSSRMLSRTVLSGQELSVYCGDGINRNCGLQSEEGA